MTYEIQISFKNKSGQLLSYNEYKYSGKTPEVDGLDRARKIVNDYFKNIDTVDIEVFEKGKPVGFNAYKKHMFLNESLYFKIRNILSKYDGNEEVSATRILTEVKREIVQHGDEYE